MSVNTTYLEALNKKDSKINKIFFKMIKLFTRKPDVIQIGVGGFSSSGKTVLIDAMFSFFDKMHIPGYIPKNFKGGFYEETEKDSNPFDGIYSDYDSLRSKVSRNFHKPNQETLDDGQWNTHTYYVHLSFCGKERLILTRNLPGEMFRIYFETQANTKDDKSLKMLFDDFIKVNKNYRSIYRTLFKKANIDSREEVERKMTEIRDEFIKTLSDKNIKQGSDLTEAKDNFFAFLFYVTSNFSIYCIKSKGRQGENTTASEKGKKEIENIYHGIRGNKGSQFMICFTQFDLILNTDNKLPQPTNRNSQSRDSNDKLMEYWLSMSELYTKINTEIVNQDEWKKLNDLVGETTYNLFTTSVAYNYSASKFYKFINSDENGANNVDDVWKEENNGRRTPIGVLELILYILKKSGFDLKKSGLPLPKTIEYNPVIKKINGEK